MSPNAPQLNKTPTDVLIRHTHASCALLVLLVSEGLCEAVGCHLYSGNVLNPDDPVGNGFTNEMIMKIDVFGTSVRYGIMGKCNGIFDCLRRELW